MVKREEEVTIMMALVVVVVQIMVDFDMHCMSCSPLSCFYTSIFSR